MAGAARMVILDRAHDPDVGHPVYAEDRPERWGEPVWAVADVRSRKVDVGEDWEIEYLAEGLTHAEAEAY